MKSFMKWPHIDNLYQLDRDQLLADYGDTEFAVTEKLDGCNVCLSCDFSQPNVRAFSRNGEDWTKSKDLNPALERVMPFVNFLRERFENQKTLMGGLRFEGFYLYGELVNTKTMNRITYEDGKPNIVFFGFTLVYKNGEVRRMPFYDLYFLYTMFYRYYRARHSGVHILPPLRISLVPTKTKDFSIRIRLKDIDFDRLSKQSDFSEGHELEGYVFHNLDDNTKDKFPAFKFKLPEFEEVLKRKRVNPNAVAFNREVNAANAEFKTYLNKNRVLSLFSKIGIPEQKEIPKAVKMLIEDAKEDFFKDHPEYANHEELKRILNVGSMPFLLIKGVLNERN